MVKTSGLLLGNSKVETCLGFKLMETSSYWLKGGQKKFSRTSPSYFVLLYLESSKQSLKNNLLDGIFSFVFRPFYFSHHSKKAAATSEIWYSSLFGYLSRNFELVTSPNVRVSTRQKSPILAFGTG
jgi:hypothetical protein